MNSIITSLTLTVGGAALAVMVKHFIDNPVREIAFNIPWFRVKADSLAGYWLAEYRFFEQGVAAAPLSQVSALYELIEWPGHVVLIREIPIEEKPSVIVIKAKRRNGYLSGIYENANDHDTLHGVFQLWIHPRGQELRGHFLGFSAEVPNAFNVGEWSWSRITTSREKNDLERAKAKFSELRAS